jgi:hypothetical protein
MTTEGWITTTGYRKRMSAVLLALALVATGCDAPPAERSAAESDGAPESTAQPTWGSTPWKCGEPFQPPGGTALTLTGHFPDLVVMGVPTVGPIHEVAGTVEVTSRVTIRGTGSPAVGGFLVADGRIVTSPPAQRAIDVPLEFPAGEVTRVPSLIGLLTCDGVDPAPPGDYEAYTWLMITQGGVRRLEFFGGPQPIRLW